MAAQHCGRPRETDAWLEVPAAIEPIIETPAGSVLAGEVNITGGHVVIGLQVVGFYPRSVGVVTQTEIQSQAVREAPRVLSVDTNDIAGLLPGFAGADTTAKLKGEPEEEVRSPIPSAGASTTDSVAAEPAVKIHDAKLTIVTRIEGLDNLTPELPTKFNVVPAARPGYCIFELPDVVVEARGTLLGPQVVEG